MTKITVVGEVVVDRVITGDSHVDVAGGSAANTALALVKAGSKVHLRARYSKDHLGRYLRNSSLAGGINLDDAVAAIEPATLVEIDVDEAGVPHYNFVMRATADWHWTAEEISKPLPSGTQAVIIGSLASVIEPAADVLFSWAQSVKSASTLLCFDPNARPTALEAWGLASSARQRTAQWITIADLVKVSEEDLAWLEPDQKPYDVAARWSTQGPKFVVLTQGGDGAAAFVDGHLVCVLPGVQVPVVDTVGAGDTFFAWLVQGYIELPLDQRKDSFSLLDVMAVANQAAALNCAERGCNPPMRHKLRRFMPKSMS
jgi:fructokinase